MSATLELCRPITHICTFLFQTGQFYIYTVQVQEVNTNKWKTKNPVSHSDINPTLKSQKKDLQENVHSYQSNCTIGNTILVNSDCLPYR